MKWLWPSLALPGCQCAPPVVTTDLVIEAELPGAAPSRVADRVLSPLEVELAELGGLTRMLSLAEEGKGRIYLRLEGAGDGVAAIQASRERLARVHEVLPNEVSALRVWQPKRTQTWVAAVPPEQANALVSDLALRGTAAEAVTAPSGRMVWTVNPEVLAARGLSTTAVASAIDRAVAAQEPITADLVVQAAPQGAAPVRLGDLATSAPEPGPAEAWWDGRPASMVVSQGEGPVAGWTRPAGAVAGRWCGVAQGLGAERASGPGLWIRDGSRWTVRGLASPDALNHVGAGQVWPCEGAQVVRVGVASRRPGADLDVALTALGALPQVYAMVAVGTHDATPQLQLNMERDRALVLGISHQDVARALALSTGSGSGGAAVVLRLPERDIEALQRVPIPTSSGAFVPLMAVASLSEVLPEPPVVRIDGRESRLVDLVVGPDFDLARWAAPSDVEVLEVDGLGPRWRAF